MGRFLLTQMASVAELEGGSDQRAHQGCAGGREGARREARQSEWRPRLQGKQAGNAEAVVVIKMKARVRAENLRAIVGDIRDQGIVGIRKIADALNARDILTPRGRRMARDECGETT